MAADLPFIRWFPAEYLRDTEILSLAAQGAWMRMLMSMWHPDRRGVLSLRLAALARLLGATENLAKGLLGEIEECAVAKVEWEGDRVTITSRRMVRDWEELAKAKESLSDAGKRGAAKRWGPKGKRPRDGPPDGEANSHPNSQPISPAYGNSEARSQKSEEGTPLPPSPPLAEQPAAPPPCSLAQALAVAASGVLGRISPAAVEHWWHFRHAAGWLKGESHTRIVQWQSDLKLSAEWAEEGAKKQRGKAGGSGFSAADVGI